MKNLNVPDYNETRKRRDNEESYQAIRQHKMEIDTVSIPSPLPIGTSTTVWTCMNAR